MYFFAAAVGTAGVYHGARPLGTACGWFPTAGAAPVSNAVPSSERPVLSAQPHPLHSAETSSAPAPVVSSSPSQTVSAPVATPTGTPADASAATPPPTVPVPSTVPPATVGCKAWGLTLATVSYYSAAGERRGQLPIASLMDIEGTCDSSRGEMVRGRLERDGAMIGPYLVAASELVQFATPRSDVTPEIQSLLKQYYVTKNQLAERIAELKKDAADANPNASAYREALRQYNDFGAREKLLTEKRDRASGAERMRLMDQLRAMIPENTRLLRAVEESKTRYNSWKKSHPTDAPDTSKDARVQELQRRLSEIAPSVKDFVN